jgi:hypothetical protein
MNWQEFENSMSQGMQGHESPVDTDALWQGIQQKRRRRKPFLLWWWGCAGLLGLGTLGLVAYLWLSPNAKPNIAATSSSAPMQPTGATMVIDNRAQPPSADPLAAQAAEHNITNTMPETFENTHLTHKKTTSYSQKTSAHHPTRALRQELSTQKAKTTNQSTSDPIAVTTLPTTALADLAPASAGAGPANQTKMEEKANGIHAILGFLPTLLNGIEAKELPAQLPNHTPAPYELPTKKANARRPLLVGAQAQVGIWRRFEVVSTEFDPTPIAEPHRNERLLEARQYRLAVAIPIAKRAYFTTGLGHARYNSVLQWNRTWVGDSTPVQVPSLYANGTQSQDTILVRTLMSRTVQHYNHVSSWQIPVEFRYDFGKKILISPYIGLHAQFRQRAQGRLLNDDDLPDNGQNQPAIYRRSWVLGGQLGFDATMPLGKQFQVGLGSFISLDASDRTRVTGSERFGQWGVRVGIWKVW